MLLTAGGITDHLPPPPSDRHSGEEDLRHGLKPEEDQEWSDHRVLHGQFRHSEQLPVLQHRDLGLMSGK